MSRKHQAIQKCGAYNDTGNVHQLDSRFGKATLTYGEYRGHYQTLWFEGCLDAVFWFVGQRLNATDHCYEGCFSVEKVEVIEKGDWNKYQHVKVTCEQTSYVGD